MVGINDLQGTGYTPPKHSPIDTSEPIMAKSERHAPIGDRGDDLTNLLRSGYRNRLRKAFGPKPDLRKKNLIAEICKELDLKPDTKIVESIVRRNKEVYLRKALKYTVQCTKVKNKLSIFLWKVRSYRKEAKQ